MTFRVPHSNMVNFLQRTPLGVILNRFSNDINNVDRNFSTVYIEITYYVFGLFGATGILLFGIRSYLVLIPLALYMIVASWVSNVYMKARREVSRLTLTWKSPVAGLPTSCIAGGPLIRSLYLQDYFSKMMEKRIEENTKNKILMEGVPYWFEWRVDLCKYLVLQLPLYLVMGYNLYNYKTEDSAALVNFLFSVKDFAPDFTRLLRLRQTTEINALSFERCFAYEDLKTEKGYKDLDSAKEKINPENRKKAVRCEVITPANRQAALKCIEDHFKVDMFPQGTVEFRDVSAWYPTSQRRNINRLNIVVPSGQKVGIVGRSGAGKSTFVKLLWRAMEPRVGSILVDGVDINTLDLKAFREQLNIILQKPSIFKGTLASNISSKKLSESQLENISSKMLDLGFPASKLTDGRLEYGVNLSGNNLSLSEKQVICLIQSVLKESKIVIMDEATAYVDPAMEEKFNSMIWSTFKNSTMFVIAHRIKSVMNCDRILVFEKGEVIEDGSPSDLLSDQKTIFYDMWKKGQ